MIPLSELVPLNWDEIMTTAFFSLLSAGGGTAVTFLVFKAKVTEELKAIRGDVTDLKDSFSKHITQNQGEFNSVRREMDTKIKDCHEELLKSEGRFLESVKELTRANADDHKTIVGTLVDISKSIQSMIKEIGFMSGKLESHIENSK